MRPARRSPSHQSKVAMFDALVSIPERPAILPISGSVTPTWLHLHQFTCRRLRHLFTHPSLPLRRHEKVDFHGRTWQVKGTPGNSSERSCACR